MNTPSHCPQCSHPLQPSDLFCAHCNAGIVPAFKSQKSAVTTLLLCLFLGSLGIHRFYVGKIKTGLLMLITGGGLGIWTLVDLITIACCRFKDSEGRTLIFTQVHGSTFKTILVTVGSVIAAIFIYVLALLTLVFYLTSPMTDTIQNQLKALREGNLAGAYSYMADQSETNVSFEDFKNYVDTHPAMINNEKTSFTERKIENGRAYAKGVMTTNDGNQHEVEYMLEKQGDIWKIVGLRVGAVITSDNSDTSPQTYTDVNNAYTIQYPGDWTHEASGKASVLFSGKEGSPSYATAITIQAISTNGANPKDNPVKIVMDDLKNQINTQTSDVKFIDSGSAELPSDTSVHGEYFIATYTYKDQAMKKMQYILMSKDGKMLYSWSFTSPKDQYEVDLPVAKTMYESWTLK